MAEATVPPANAPKATARPQRVITLEVVRIEGRIQKPQAFYVLQRAALAGLERGLTREDFLPRILASVEADPF